MYFLKNKNLEATLIYNPFELISLKNLAKNIFINKILYEKNCIKKKVGVCRYKKTKFNSPIN